MNKKIVTLITVTLVVALVTTCGVAQSEEDKASGKTFYMFVQTADSGLFIPVEGEENLYHLTLEGVAGNTIYFSDRPERVVGQAPMGDFLDGLGFSEDNPPNAALEILEAEESTDLVVLELFDPAYHAESNTLEYTASILQEPDHSYAVFNERHDKEIPKSFGANSLFIDDCLECRKWTNPKMPA